MPPGQPTKYKKVYCKRVIECLKEGGHNVTFCATIPISEDTFYEWRKVHPEFSEAVKIGEVLRKARFLEKVDKCAFDPEGNPANNGLIYLSAYQVGLKVKPEKEETNTAEDIADVLMELAKNKLK